jgi:hypothetical protein
MGTIKLDPAELVPPRVISAGAFMIVVAFLQMRHKTNHDQGNLGKPGTLCSSAAGYGRSCIHLLVWARFSADAGARPT